jgi:hypothetical protein
VMVVVNLAWAFGVTFALISFIRRFITLRVSPEVELEGLDMPEFGALAYPEFVLTSTGSRAAGSAAIPEEKPAGIPPPMLDGEDARIEIPEAVVIETARRVLELVRAGDREE